MKKRRLYGFRRLLSCVLALLMVLTLLPGSAFAAAGDDLAPEDYQIILPQDYTDPPMGIVLFAEPMDSMEGENVVDGLGDSTSSVTITAAVAKPPNNNQELGTFSQKANHPDIQIKKTFGSVTAYFEELEAKLTLTSIGQINAILDQRPGNANDAASLAFVFHDLDPGYSHTSGKYYKWGGTFSYGVGWTESAAHIDYAVGTLINGDIDARSVPHGSVSYTTYWPIYITAEYFDTDDDEWKQTSHTYKGPAGQGPSIKETLLLELNKIDANDYRTQKVSEEFAKLVYGEHYRLGMFNGYFIMGIAGEINDGGNIKADPYNRKFVKINYTMEYKPISAVSGEGLSEKVYYYETVAEAIQAGEESITINNNYNFDSTRDDIPDNKTIEIKTADSVSLSGTIKLGTNATLLSDSELTGVTVQNGGSTTITYNAALKCYTTKAVINTVSITGDVSTTPTSPIVGETLTANVTETGNGALSSCVTYQWQRSDTENDPYSDIASATSAAYTVTSDDIGKYIKVVVTGDGNTVYPSTKEAKTGPVAARSAAIGNITITGTKGTALSPDVDVTITLTGDAFKDAMSAGNTITWLDLPAGLSAIVKTDTAAKASAVTLTISGTPTVVSSANIIATIPAVQLYGGSELTTTTNESAKYSISAPAIDTSLSVTLTPDSTSGSRKINITYPGAAAGYKFYYAANTSTIAAPATGNTFILSGGSGTYGSGQNWTEITANTAFTGSGDNTNYYIRIIKVDDADNVIVATGEASASTPAPVPATYTVSFDANGGSAVTALTGIKSGAKITAPTAPTKEGYTFGGWYKDAGFAAEWNFASDTVTGNTTMYAKWVAITYTVSFSTNGGSAVAAQTGITSGAKITAPTAPTKEGYTFGGWYKDSGFATEWDFASDTVTGDITLYAKWDAITYTVSFSTDGGSAVAAQTGITSGAKITAPTAPTKEGYTFGGWYKDAGFATAWNFASDTVTGDITLYAKWDAITYTVSFSTDGSSAVTAQTGITSGAKITAPTAPTKEGYTFSGWYKDAGFAAAWDFAIDTVTSDITLYAKWTENLPPLPEIVSVTVSGTARVGETLTASAKDAEGNVLTKGITITWQSYDGAAWNDIAVSAVYVPGEDDAGKEIRAVAAGDETDASGTAYASAGIVESAPAEPVQIASVTVSGTAKEGETLTAEAKDADGKTLTKGVTLKWQRSLDGSVWADITASGSYKISASDVGKFIRAAASGNGTDAAGTVFSASSDKVAPLPITIASVDLSVSSAKVGDTLTAVVKDSSGAVITTGITYQWQRASDAGRVDIEGASAPAYAVTQDDEGSLIAVSVAGDGVSTLGRVNSATVRIPKIISTSEDLAAAIADEETPGNIAIEGDLELELSGEKALEIKQETIIEVPSGSSLTVNGENPLVVNEVLEIKGEGTLKVDGKLEINDEKGGLIIDKDSSLDVNGQVDVGNGKIEVNGSMNIGEGGSVEIKGEGTVAVAEGKTLNVVGVLNNGGKILLLPNAAIDMSGAAEGSAAGAIVDEDEEEITVNENGVYEAPTYTIKLGDNAAGGKIQIDIEKSNGKKQLSEEKTVLVQIVSVNADGEITEIRFVNVPASQLEDLELEEGESITIWLMQGKDVKFGSELNVKVRASAGENA